jgi:Spy/CpxP family protein refolding chaperone
MRRPLTVLLTAGVLGLSGLVAAGAAGRAGGLAGGGRGRAGAAAVGEAPVLTARQQRQFDLALQKVAARLRALEEKLRVAQQEVFAAAVASPFDEKAVRNKAEAAARTQADITLVRAKALAAMAQNMGSSQKQQFSAAAGASSLLTGELAASSGPAAGGSDPGGSAAGRGRTGSPAVGQAANSGAPVTAQGEASGGTVELTAEQQRAFQQALQKDLPRLRNMGANLRSAINDLVVTTLASDYNEESIREKAAAVAGVQVAMGTMRLKALAAVAQAMSPEQKRQLIDSPATFPALSEGSVNSAASGRGGSIFGVGRDPLPKER